MPEIKATASRAVDIVMDAVRARRAPRAGRRSISTFAAKGGTEGEEPAVARDYVAGLAETGDSPRTEAASPSPRPSPRATVVRRRPAARQGGRTGPRRLERGRSAPGRWACRWECSRAPQQSELETGPLAGPAQPDDATMAAASALLLAGLGALGGSGASRDCRGRAATFSCPRSSCSASASSSRYPAASSCRTSCPTSLQGMVGGSAGAQLRAYLASVLGPIARSFS